MNSLIYKSLPLSHCTIFLFFSKTVSWTQNLRQCLLYVHFPLFPSISKLHRPFMVVFSRLNFMSRYNVREECNMFSYQKLQVAIVILGLLLLQSVECRKGLIEDSVTYSAIACRKHSALLTDFGAVGDGKTSNTKAFKAAVDKLSQFASDGGAQLIVPAGKWLTGSFNLTSHFTLFLHKDAVILGSQVWFLALICFLFNF